MITYKVLWVDDDLSIIQSYQSIAEDYDIELIHKGNWNDAEIYLKENFDAISAIILDANCKISKENLEEEIFIPSVLPSMLSLFGERQRTIPWYLLSAGTMANFGFVVKSAQLHHLEDWGEMLYLKDLEDENPRSSAKLFENIQHVVKGSSANTVLFRHRNVFKYIGEGRLIDNRARYHLVLMLSALYYPEENIKFQYEGNPLRKVIEYLFRSANKYGLLPDDCFDPNRHIVLLDASRFMAGIEINSHDGKNIKYKIRYGEPGDKKGGAGGDCIFNEEIAMLVKNILNFSSSDSHTDEYDPYIIEGNKKDLFFGYVLQLCHVIKWYGEYIEAHSDIEANKSLFKIIPINSTSKDSDTPLVSMHKRHTETMVEEIPTKESLIGTTGTIMYNRNGKLVCGQYCKISTEHSKSIRKTATLKQIEINDGKDSKDLPYTATEIEIK